MNRIKLVCSLALASSLAVTGCKSKEGDAGKAGAAPSDETGGDTAAKAPSMTINDADWVAKNLHDVAPLINITMRVPKAAKLEKNGNGGVDITVSPFYMLTVSAIAVSNVAEGIKSDKSMTVDAKDRYINIKVLADEPNGFVYTYQMKDEENGTKYQPEAHFAFYVEKDGAIYSILDQRPLDAFSTPGSAYSQDIATKVYAIVKGSAKVN